MSKSKEQIEIIARAVLTQGPWLLACKNVKAGNYYLPGGHIEFNEPAAAALARELREEADLKIHVGPLLLANESAFRAKGRVHHEVNLVFHVERRGGGPANSRTPPPPVRSREQQIAFEWVDLRRISECNLLPPAIRSWLGSWFAAGSPKECSTWNSGMGSRRAGRRKS